MSIIGDGSMYNPGFIFQIVQLIQYKEMTSRNAGCEREMCSHSLTLVLV
jgi:hypothetical protein